MLGSLFGQSGAVVVEQSQNAVNISIGHVDGNSAVAGLNACVNGGSGSVDGIGAVHNSGAGIYADAAVVKGEAATGERPGALQQFVDFFGGDFSGFFNGGNFFDCFFSGSLLPPQAASANTIHSASNSANPAGKSHVGSANIGKMEPRGGLARYD